MALINLQTYPSNIDSGFSFACVKTKSFKVLSLSHIETVSGNGSSTYLESQ